ncbi:uncharacterized protein KQ657_000218 [Scheffersomyces spartinae]|uniref:FAD dependent oxidoreductase domain-containing protein n=1 Tax=Scheffersomyces spartinae TaxID=45513 RepID=A0A9P7VE80_9ASCO|nr:uncharacterized protein KQ657_000218 [Scheffersomyces spartinae]KAG7196205.1 hypothetical protein KQ657_000218 [Scheffersomyces spartinae]
MPTDYLKFHSIPSGRHKDKHHIVIVGAGIIGVCTAYYLVRHPDYDPEKFHITVIESKRVAGGASGKAGGLLALWAFPQQLVPLSFELHQELSDLYNGTQEWGYRRLTTVQLEGDLTLVDSSKDNDNDNYTHADSKHDGTNVNGFVLHSSDEDDDCYESSVDPLHRGKDSLENEEIFKKTTKQRSNSVSSSSLTSSDRPPKKTSKSSRSKLSGATSTPLENSASNQDNNGLISDSNSSARSSMSNAPSGSSANSTFDDHDFSHTSRTSSAANTISSNHDDGSNTSDTSSHKSTRLLVTQVGQGSTTTSQSQGGYNTRSRRQLPSKLPPNLNWIDSSIITNCSSLGGTDTTAQVHPYKFTNFILKKAVEDSKGSIELILGKVGEITYSMETGQATGIKYKPTSVKDDHRNKRLVALYGDQIVLTVGPWTSKILPDCPILGLRAHSITISPYEDQPVSPYAIFSEFKTGPYSYISPEIYARQDEVYVCGEGDSTVDVPDTTDDVEVVKSKCDELFKQVGKISPNLRRGRILKRQACYLPVLDVPSSSGPLIGETNVENLYLASGHSCWGINNAPGTGKIMSELLLEGEVTSADILTLDPLLYFDASVLISDEEDNDEEEEDES